MAATSSSYVRDRTRMTLCIQQMLSFTSSLTFIQSLKRLVTCSTFRFDRPYVDLDSLRRIKSTRSDTFSKMRKRRHTQKLGSVLRFVTPPITKILIHGEETRILFIRMGSFAGSTNTRKMEASFFRIFPRIPIRAIWI